MAHQNKYVNKTHGRIRRRKTRKQKGNEIQKEMTKHPHRQGKKNGEKYHSIGFVY